jgi:hypothetical protein
VPYTEKEHEIVKELHLLTNKKFIYVLNVSEGQLKEGWQPDSSLLKELGTTEYVIFSSAFELLLSESPSEEQKIYLEDVGLKQSGLDTLITKSYIALNLITFLTTGEDETRAWTSPVNTPISKASRAIHTDFEQLFIRAEVIPWQELLNVGSWAAARQSGKLRTVGKDYIVQDGDVVEIKI